MAHADLVAPVKFLSADWFRSAREVANRVVLPAASSCRVQFEAGGLRSYLIVERGRVTAWEAGSMAEPDVELSWPWDTAFQIATGDVDGNVALAATSATVRLREGTYVGTPAPMDLLRRPELAAMPTVPDATLVVHHQFSGSMFGDIDYTISFVYGRLRDERIGPPEITPDARVAVSYRAMARVRTRECSILEALEDGGSIDGNVSSMATLAALYEHPVFADAMFATGPHALALATLGELRADETFRAGMGALMRTTRTGEPV
jgi:hypothetical protein